MTPAGNKSGCLFLPAPNPALLQAGGCSPSARAVSLLLLLLVSGAAVDCLSAKPVCQQGATSHVHTLSLPQHFPISNKPHYCRDSPDTCLEGWNLLTTPNQGFLLHTNSAITQGYEAKRIDSLHPVTHRTQPVMSWTQPRKSSDLSHCSFI